MLRRLYDWCIGAADKPYAVWILGMVSFAESSFFPVPPDVMLIPMSLAQPRKAWLFALVCTITSVAGGVLGYAIGALLYDFIGGWIIQLYGYGNKMDAFRESYAEWGAMIILIKGMTPIPYKLVTISLGLCRLQPVPVHRAVDHHPRGALLPARVPAQSLRTAGARDHREASRLLGDDRRGRAGARIRRRLTGCFDRGSVGHVGPFSDARDGVG